MVHKGVGQDFCWILGLRKHSSQIIISFPALGEFTQPIFWLNFRSDLIYITLKITKKPRKNKTEKKRFQKFNGRFVIYRGHSEAVEKVVSCVEVFKRKFSVIFVLLIYLFFLISSATPLPVDEAFLSGKSQFSRTEKGGIGEVWKFVKNPIFTIFQVESDRLDSGDLHFNFTGPIPGRMQLFEVFSLKIDIHMKDINLRKF